MLILINGRAADSGISTGIRRLPWRGIRAFEILAENPLERMKDENIEFMLGCSQLQRTHFPPRPQDKALRNN